MTEKAKVASRDRPKDNVNRGSGWCGGGGVKGLPLRTESVYSEEGSYYSQNKGHKKLAGKVEKMQSRSKKRTGASQKKTTKSYLYLEEMVDPDIVIGERSIGPFSKTIVGGSGRSP